MSRTKNAVIVGVSAVGAAAILAMGASAIANADTTSSSSTPSATASTSTQAPGTDAGTGTPPKGVAGDASHAGPGETLLTGTTAAKVKAAALDAVPGATVVRVETDSGSATYEAHVTTSSGAAKTVKINADFTVAAVQDGMGSGPAGSRPAAPGGTTGTAPSSGSTA